MAGQLSAFAGTIRVTDATPVAYVRFSTCTGSTAATFDLGNGSAVMHTRNGNPVSLGALAGGINTTVEGARSTAGALTPYSIGANNSSTIFNGTIMDGTVAGAAVSITKVGTGTLTLTGTNTYSGGTIVSNGVLLVNGGIYNGTNDAPVIVVGGTLGGGGTIGGAVTNQSGGILVPGAGTNVAGTVMTLSSNLTLLAGSTTLMQVVHGSPADQVTSAGTITYGGILMVATNAGDGTPYQVGDTFTLFNLGGGNGSYNAGSGFATIQPPPGPGLGWSGANLTLNGSIQVVAASPVLANFSGTPVAGVPPLAVTFTNQSSGAGYWVWNFGDGTTLSTGGGTNVSHAYANVGSYTVSLTAYGTGGVSGLTNVAYIVVGSAAPVAGFGGDDERVCDADGDVDGRLDGEHHELGVELWGWPQRDEHIERERVARVCGGGELPGEFDGGGGGRVEHEHAGELRGGEAEGGDWGSGVERREVCVQRDKRSGWGAIPDLDDDKRGVGAGGMDPGVDERVCGGRELQLHEHARGESGGLLPAGIAVRRQTVQVGCAGMPKGIPAFFL